MTKQELRRMIREEVRKELQEILPDILKEAIRGVLKNNKSILKGNYTPQAKIKSQNNVGQSFDPTRLKELIGYGDFVPGMAGRADVPSYSSHLEESQQRTQEAVKIAGVPVSTGLKAYEEAQSTGMSFREMPPELQEAIAKSKKTFDKSEKVAHFRPGKK